jgi:hypothetical protein
MSIYEGTSLWLWVVKGLVWVLAAAAVVWIMLELLKVIVILGLAALAGFLLWIAWDEIHDRRYRPLVLTEENVRALLYPTGKQRHYPRNVDVLSSE